MGYRSMESQIRDILLTEQRKNNVGGAGEIGTEKLVKKYTEETPGQVVPSETVDESEKEEMAALAAKAVAGGSFVRKVKTGASNHIGAKKWDDAAQNGGKIAVEKKETRKMISRTSGGVTIRRFVKEGEEVVNEISDEQYWHGKGYDAHTVGATKKHLDYAIKDHDLKNPEDIKHFTKGFMRSAKNHTPESYGQKSTKDTLIGEEVVNESGQAACLPRHKEAKVSDFDVRNITASTHDKPNKHQKTTKQKVSDFDVRNLTATTHDKHFKEEVEQTIEADIKNSEVVKTPHDLKAQQKIKIIDETKNYGSSAELIEATAAIGKAAQEAHIKRLQEEYNYKVEHGYIKK